MQDLIEQKFVDSFVKKTSDTQTEFDINDVHNIGTMASQCIYPCWYKDENTQEWVQQYTTVETALDVLYDFIETTDYVIAGLNLNQDDYLTNKSKVSVLIATDDTEEDRPNLSVNKPQ